MKTPENFTPAANCLENKIILVTGAGDGIGRVAAKTFAAHRQRYVKEALLPAMAANPEFRNLNWQAGRDA